MIKATINGISEMPLPSGAEVTAEAAENLKSVILEASRDGREVWRSHPLHVGARHWDESIVHHHGGPRVPDVERAQEVPQGRVAVA
jgi:hypothetical protein